MNITFFIKNYHTIYQIIFSRKLLLSSSALSFILKLSRFIYILLISMNYKRNETHNDYKNIII